MTGTTYIPATRVTLVCPCGTGALFRATNSIIENLRKQGKIKGWGGFTYSRPTPPVYQGYFWDTTGPRNRWTKDQHVIILIDVPNSDPADLLPYLTRLRAQMNTKYAQVNQSQKSLWITVQSLSILDV